MTARSAGNEVVARIAYFARVVRVFDEFTRGNGYGRAGFAGPGSRRALRFRPEPLGSAHADAASPPSGNDPSRE